MTLEFEKEKSTKDMTLEPFLCGKCGENDFAVYGNFETFSMYCICKQCRQLNRFEFRLTQKDKPTGKQ